ncbi:MAG: DUF814 domain-containing protein [Spirochaetales bacterium]|nr:DUF814 domain-containing protein [Spirochaetales bacterium]
MSLNWKEIDLLLSELDIPGAYIQQVHQHEYPSIILELKNKAGAFPLLLSTRRDFVRLCCGGSVTKKGLSTQRFAQLLRSRVRNGKITRVDHIHSQRIVRFTLQKAEEKLYMYFRMWNNGSNILLTDGQHSVIDALYRRPASGEISGGIYNPEQSLADRSSTHECKIRPFPHAQKFSEYICTTLRDSEQEFLLTIEKARLKNIIEHNLCQIQASIAQKINSMEEHTGSRCWSHYGDLILSNIHLIRPGSRNIQLHDYENGDATVVIELDPSLSPSENAQKYYIREKKARQKQQYLKDEIQNQAGLQRRLEYGLQSLEEACTAAQVKALSSTLFPKEKHTASESVGPGLCFYAEGFTILVGRDSRENDAILRTKVRGNDWWLHTRDTPGGYVFVKAPKGKTVPLTVLLDAGQLAVFFSKSKGLPRVNLYYTQVKYLRRAKGAKQGTVIPFQEKNLEIQTDEPRLLRLLGRE